MNQIDQCNRIEPFVITKEIENKMVSRGYTFEPPNRARTISLPEILAGLSDDELARWEGDFVNGELVKTTLRGSQQKQQGTPLFFNHKSRKFRSIL